MIFKCKVCNKVFEVKDGETPVCPLCKATGDKLESIIENNINNNQYKSALKKNYAVISEAFRLAYGYDYDDFRDWNYVHLQVKVKQETNIHTLLLQQKKKDMNKLQKCF